MPLARNLARWGREAFVVQASAGSNAARQPDGWTTNHRFMEMLEHFSSSLFSVELAGGRGIKTGVAVSRQGRLKIAQRFIAGNGRLAQPSPGGTQESDGRRRCVA